jgi:hypothetical protein
LGIAVIPPRYGGVSRQNALFAPKCGKITVNPREPFSALKFLHYTPVTGEPWLKSEPVDSSSFSGLHLSGNLRHLLVLSGNGEMLE